MALILGTARDNVDGVGRTVWGTIDEDGQDPSVLPLTAEADPSATSACWSATTRPIAGYIDRISVQPVTGYTPSSTFTLTIADAYGSSWTYAAIPTAGDTNILDNSWRDAVRGPITLSIDDMGARKRVEITIFIGSQAIGPISHTHTDLDMPIWYPPASGDYTTGLFNRIHGTGGTATADRLYAVPCVLPVGASYSGMTAHVDTGNAGANARIGVYADNGSGLPGALIAEAAAFTPTATAHHDVSFAANQTLGPGLVWLGLVTDDAVVIWERTFSESCYNIRAVQSGGNLVFCLLVYVAHVYAALPDPFGSATYLDWTVPWRLGLIAA